MQGFRTDVLVLLTPMVVSATVVHAEDPSERRGEIGIGTDRHFTGAINRLKMTNLTFLIGYGIGFGPRL